MLSFFNTAACLYGCLIRIKEEEKELGKQKINYRIWGGEDGKTEGSEIEAAESEVIKTSLQVLHSKTLLSLVFC